MMSSVMLPMMAGELETMTYYDVYAWVQEQEEKELLLANLLSDEPGKAKNVYDLYWQAMGLES
jgi:hypothetical protein